MSFDVVPRRVPLVAARESVLLVPRPLVELFPNLSWLTTMGWVIKFDPTFAPLGWVVNASLLATPTTSVSVPQFETPLVTLTIEAVPDFVMFPLANGVPAEGRTRIFCHV